MNDPFAELGLPRGFEIDDAALAAARDRTGNAAAYQALADPRERAETLLTLLEGGNQEVWRGVPNDFAAALAAAGSDAQKLAALRQQRLTNIMYLFRQLESNDKGPVQAGRQRMVRAELNALDQLAPLLSQG